MPTPVWTYPLHHISITTPMLWPLTHMMLGAFVDGAYLTLTHPPGVTPYRLPALQRGNLPLRWYDAVHLRIAMH